ncbi:MAG: cell division protein FtsQ/DivIB [Lachnospiraceae bacterium]|nr:cell division protein FtsQ/DivIB [Lachnospiraceae bacterium]
MAYREMKKKIIALAVLLVLLIALAVFWKILDDYEVRKVYVEGNTHYTVDEISRMVQKGWFGNNTLILSAKYSNKSITGVPFIETMDVSVEDKNTIRINVYEKALAGYVSYLDGYMYFDRDGIVVENSRVITRGIPLVTGLDFDHFVMYEPLPVKNETVFNEILGVTQMLGKYKILTDRIYFDKNYEMTLYFNDIRVELGNGDLIEEKIQRLNAILPELEGLSGVLRLGGYQTGQESITFTKDEKDEIDHSGQEE